MKSVITPYGTASLLILLTLALVSCSKRSDPHGMEVVPLEINSLWLAIRSYEAEYNNLPFSTISNGLQQNEVVIAILCAKSDDPIVRKMNPMGKQFLTIPVAKLIHGQFVDPWSNPYNIAFSTNGHLQLGGKDNATNIAIWSNGANGSNEFGEGDDIASWKLGTQIKR